MHRPDPDEPRRRIVLLIEDESHVRQFLRAALVAAGWQLVEAGTAREGLAEAAGRRPDVILLDLGLPDVDGIEVTRRIREWSTTPIIVISAREQDKVAVLDAGADDYLTKPFGIDELLARIRVVLRHRAMAPGQPVPVFESRGVRVDLGARSVTRDGNEVQLTPTEYRLLAVLVSHAGKILTHHQLLKEVWGTHAQAEGHNLRVHVNQLRHKLELDAYRPRLIQAELGVGYRLRID